MAVQGLLNPPKSKIVDKEGLVCSALDWEVVSLR